MNAERLRGALAAADALPDLRSRAAALRKIIVGELLEPEHAGSNEMSTPLTDEQIMAHWGRRDECLHGRNVVIWFARAIARAILSTQSTNTAGPEPVAWRYRYSPKGRWNLADEPANDPNIEEEPLYLASPIAQPPASPSDGDSTERTGEAVQRPADGDRA